jgi:hypothetical protein
MPVDPQIQALLDKGTGVPATHTLPIDVFDKCSFYPLARARGSTCRRGYGVLRTGKAAPHLRFVKKGVAASSRIELADTGQLTVI